MQGLKTPNQLWRKISDSPAEEACGFDIIKYLKALQANK